jgi:hypothetical protein
MRGITTVEEVLRNTVGDEVEKPAKKAKTTAEEVVEEAESKPEVEASA